jgi:3-oxoadipate enol-lactonase
VNAVLFGHGMWSDAQLFLPMMRGMQVGARLMAIDFPGHGDRTQEPPARTIEDLAREYLKAIPEEADRAVLVGISMGAVAALHAALLAPDRVAGLLLLSGSAAAEPPGRGVGYRALAGAYRVLGANPPLRWALTWLAFGPEHEVGGPAGQRVIARAEAVPRRTVAASLRLMADRPSVEHRLHEITCPVAVVAGENDRVLPGAHSRILAGRLPHARLYVIPDTGHAIVVERPDTAARIADDFLARLGIGPGERRVEVPAADSKANETVTRGEV